MVPVLKSGFLPQWDYLGENEFVIFEWLSIGDRLWVWWWGLFLLLISVLWFHLVQTHANPVHAAGIAVGSYVYEVLLCLECFVFLVSSFSLSNPSFSGLPKPWRERYNGSIPFGTECSKVSQSLHIAWLWVTICYMGRRRTLLWWWSSKELTYEYSTTLLGTTVRNPLAEH